MSEYLRSYLTLGILLATAVGLVVVMLGVGRLLRPSNPTQQKLINYESGVDPVSGGWSQANIRYYMFALLFVFFDVEAAFIFAWAVQVDPMGTYGVVAMTMFLGLIALGLLYDWRKGLMRWV